MGKGQGRRNQDEARARKKMESIRGKEFLLGNILRHPVFVLFLAGAFLGAGASLLLSSSLPPPEADGASI